MRYFVSYYIHNGVNDGWDYKVIASYTDFGAAKKAYHSKLAEFIGGSTYDKVSVLLTDSYSNIKDSEYWEAPAPEPTTEG